MFEEIEERIPGLIENLKRSLDRFAEGGDGDGDGSRRIVENDLLSLWMAMRVARGEESDPLPVPRRRGGEITLEEVRRNLLDDATRLLATEAADRMWDMPPGREWVVVVGKVDAARSGSDEPRKWIVTVKVTKAS